MVDVGIIIYTNILRKEGINAVAKCLKKEDTKTTKTIPTRVIVKLSLILNLNNFTFNDENYLRIIESKHVLHVQSIIDVL